MKMETGLVRINTVFGLCLGSTLIASGIIGCIDESMRNTPQMSKAALENGFRLSEIPSAPPVILRWVTAPDGKRDVKSLDLEIENTTVESIEVDIYVTSQVGEKVSKVHPIRVKLKPHKTVTQSVAIDQLGVQVVGVSASTLITAVYKTADGLDRAAALPSVWIEHKPGFGAARVRGAIEEGLSNAAKGFANSKSRNPRAARALDTRSGRIEEISIPTDDSFSAAKLFVQPSWLPDPVDYVADYQRNPRPETDGISDAERTPAAGDDNADAFDKGGNYKICFRTPYWFVDTDRGEDYLNDDSLTAEGYEPSRYAFAALANSMGWVFWANFLDAYGCTPSMNFANGIYAAYATSAAYRPESNMLIEVTYDDTKTYLWASKIFSVSGSGGTITLTFPGASILSDAYVAAINTLFRSSPAYPNGTSISIYAQQECPPYPGEGISCASVDGTQIWLGYDTQYFPDAVYKVITQHELGHTVQKALMGVPESDYSHSVSTDYPACRCDNVQPVSSRQHCLQSQEYVWAAQGEGWAHFFAAKNLNNGAHSDCTFTYYKEFRNDDGSVSQPPYPQSCYSQIRWMENHCNGTNKGTEWDWMNHYWRLANKDGYSFADFKSVYNNACGGSCNNAQVTYFMTYSAAINVFGSGSAKANAWNNAGINFGVRH